ncbi:Gfo/Idh/MocA family oxidoreductase [Paenarthrobacter sp. NPDC089714]|uniref:Gfo/Idh/MocA family protein n=1 Tax=Paenarthrobacter sp. NPDC089714 TaxID=3364377 RepID=UPI0037F8FCE3
MQRIALIGAGFMGAVHAANLAAHPNVRFDFVYDVDTERAAALAAQHGATAVTDIENIYDPTQVDAVLIASSTDTHAENLKRGADAGIAVLCEKPIDRELRQAAETVDYVNARTTRAMVAFNRRFDRDYAELRDAVASGEVGDVALIQLTSRGPEMPPREYLRVSGGQMRDQAVHFFDLARWISGMDPVEVYATGSTLADPSIAEFGDTDIAAVTLRLPTGALVQIDTSRRTGYGYDERIEVLGSNGMVEARRHRAGSVTRYTLGQAVENGMHPGWFERVRPTYAATLDYFVNSLEKGELPSPSLRDGLFAQAIAEAATRSLSSGRSEVIQYPTGITSV